MWFASILPLSGVNLYLCHPDFGHRLLSLGFGFRVFFAMAAIAFPCLSQNLRGAEADSTGGFEKLSPVPFTST